MAMSMPQGSVAVRRPRTAAGDAGCTRTFSFVVVGVLGVRHFPTVRWLYADTLRPRLNIKPRPMPASNGFCCRRLLAREPNRDPRAAIVVAAVDPKLPGDLADKRLDDFHAQPARTGGREILRPARPLRGRAERLARRRQFQPDRNRARAVFDGIGHQLIDDESERYAQQGG